MIGKTLGRYEIVAELGSGGMATVYRAKDTELGREVAIKMMHPHLAKKPEYAERFRREARAVAALRHPHIIEIHDFVSLDLEGTPLTCMVSELVEGPALSTFLEARERVLPEVAALFSAQIAEALACAHGAGIIHRDVKPENILIAEGGRVLLTDFGIARVMEGDTVTATGALIGSPSYMSPEQARGARPVAASDLFSLGVVLYRLTTGRLPFPGKDPLTVITAILKGDYRPPVQLAPEVGNRFDAIVRRCLAPDLAERYERAETLAEDLLDFAAEGGLTDAEGELRRYFAAPEAFEAAVTPRLVTTLMDRAEAKAAAGALAAALALCDRTLSLDPANDRAAALLAEVSRRRSGTRWLWIGAAALAVLVTGGAAWWALWGPGPAPRERSASAPRDATVGDASAGDAAPGTDASPPPRALDAGAPPRVAPDAALPGRPPGPGPRRTGRQPPDRRLAPNPRVTPDAAVAPVPRVTPDAAVAGPRVVSPPAPGRLQVMVLPFCDVRVDGKPLGRSPMPQPVSLPAGAHDVTCHHGPSGQVFRRRVRIEPGQTLPLRGSVLGEAVVTLRLRRGDAIQIGPVSYRSGRRVLAPGRYPYRLLKGDGELQRGWLTIPPGRCTLVDSPTPVCR